MDVTDERLFTTGVFEDADSAARAVLALRDDRFPVEAISLIGLDSEAAAALVTSLTGTPGAVLEVQGLGAARVTGALTGVLAGEDDGLASRGLAATAGRAGYQPHDGRIYDALVRRGGILVAVEGAARAADALAMLMAYGGGNAAIGAWAGRL